MVSACNDKLFIFSVLFLLFLATQLELSLNARLQVMLLEIWVQRMPIDTKNILMYVGICSHPRHRTAQNWPAEHVTRLEEHADVCVRVMPMCHRQPVAK
jgi:hypothetical protein